VPLLDCDAPIVPTPTLSNTDYIDRLNLLRPNLWRFSRFTYSGGASAVNPFTDPPVTGALSDQRKAIAMPGGSATVKAMVTDRTQGAAKTGLNGAAYNLSFDAYLIGGATSATLRAGWRDYSGAALSTSGFTHPYINDAAIDVSWTVTNVRQTFVWEGIASDDPDWFAAVPNNSQFWFFVNSSSEIPAGSILYITNIQIQLNNFFTPFPTNLPWRPARGEEDLIQYAEYILATNYAELSNKRNYKAMSGPEGLNLLLNPSGPSAFIPIEGTSFALGDAYIPPGAYLRAENAALTDFLFTTQATHGLPPLSYFEIRAHGAGGFTATEDTGVKINPNLQGVTGSQGQGDVVDYIFVGMREDGLEHWDAR